MLSKRPRGCKPTCRAGRHSRGCPLLDVQVRREAAQAARQETRRAADVERTNHGPLDLFLPQDETIAARMRRLVPPDSQAGFVGPCLIAQHAAADAIMEYLREHGLAVK
jgi:hypothetical protein